MSTIDQHWELGRVVFRFTEGNLFEAPVEAIVNSEQSDFVLSYNPLTISGQIRTRFGDDIQEQLYEQTKGLTLPAGTTLKTRPRDKGPIIYHAGFHQPGEWMDSAAEDTQSEWVNTVSRCVRTVLDDFAAGPCQSIAFPLIGCGSFGLDPALLASQFMLDVLAFAKRVNAEGGPARNIWLVVPEGPQANPVLNACIRAALNASASPVIRYDPLALGVDFLDYFERTLIECRHPQWACWLLARYTELLTRFTLAILAANRMPALLPCELLVPGRPLPFGTVRTVATNLAHSLPKDAIRDQWTPFLQDRMLEDEGASSRLEAINRDRNDIAHGRSFRTIEEMRSDLELFIRPVAWMAMRAKAGRPDLERLGPWIVSAEELAGQGEQGGGTHAVFERWTPTHYHYLIPHSGSVLQRPL